MTGPPDAAGSGSRAKWLAVALVLAVVLAYLPALDGPFTYDDRIEVVGNPSIRSLAEPWAILRYNPGRVLVVVTWALDFALWGFSPRGYHAMSILVHAVNALLVVRLARRIFARVGSAGVDTRAWVVGATWALHPMASEGVAYITGRSDALCATAWLVALAAWLDGRRTLALVATAAGLLTKEVAYTLPVALIALSVLLPDPSAQRSLPSVRRRAVALGALLSIAASLRVAASGLPRPEVSRDALTHLLTQAEGWTHLLGLWLFPLRQSVLHDLPARASWVGAFALACWLGLGALAAHRRGLIAVALLLWAAPLLPSSLLPLKETMAEHRAYSSGLGPILLIVGALPRPRAALVLALPLFAATVARARLWGDESALWGSASAANPASRDAAYGWGDALRLARRPAEAEIAYRRALAAAPDDVDARVNLGIALVEQGHADAARVTWMEVLRKTPHTCSAHNNLAALDLREGRVDEAVAGWQSTLRWCPDDALAHLGLGNLLADAGDLRAAAYHLRAFLGAAPSGHPQAGAARERLARLGLRP